MYQTLIKVNVTLKVIKFFVFSCFLSLSHTLLASTTPYLVIDDTFKPSMLTPFDDENRLVIGSKSNYYKLTPHVEYLRDSKKNLTIEEVSSAEFEAAFKSNFPEDYGFGLTEDIIWLKFTIDYPRQKLGTYENRLLLLQVHMGNSIGTELYEPIGPGYQLTKDLGSKRSRRLSSIESTRVFPIQVSLDDRKTYYLKLSITNSLPLPLVLLGQKQFIQKALAENYIIGLYLGVMLILAAYHLCIYISADDKTYLFYAMAVIGFILYAFIESGRSGLIFGKYDYLNQVVQPYTLLFSCSHLILLFRGFFNTSTLSPGYDFVLKVFLGVICVQLLVSFIFPIYIAKIWVVVLLSIVTFSLFVFGYMLNEKNNQSALPFVFAMAIINFGALVHLSLIHAILPVSSVLIFGFPNSLLVGSFILAGALTYRVKHLHEMTKNAQQKSIHSLKKYRSLFENAAEGIYEADIQGNIIKANTSLLKALDCTSVEELSSISSEVISKITPDWSEMLHLLSKGERYEELVLFQNKQGRLSNLKHRAKLVFDQRTGCYKIEGVINDQTEKVKRIEAEHAIEQAKGRKEMAAEEALAKSTFLANMSHEIRTPLTAIIGYSELLSEKSLSKQEGEKGLDIMIRSSHHLLEIINETMDFSKLGAEQLEIKKDIVDICTLMTDLKSYFSNKAKEKSIGFEIDYKFPVPSRIYADGTRLKQILLNLCSNAVKFTDKGAVKVCVSWDDTQKQTMFSVTDTGIGLSKDQCDRLFSAYSQADSSTSRQFGGTGLGLLISKELAALMGGTIEVTSQQGKGSTFTTAIGWGVPKDIGFLTNKDDTYTDQETVLNDEIYIPTFNAHILVAEDDNGNQALIKLLLQKTGALSTFVDNGLSALEHFQQSTYDLIIMDMYMPTMNGMEAVRAIRSLDSQVPIIGISAGVTPEDRLAYEKCGCSCFIEKPIDRAELYNRLSEYVEIVNDSTANKTSTRTAT